MPARWLSRCCSTRPSSSTTWGTVRDRMAPLRGDHDVHRDRLLHLGTLGLLRYGGAPMSALPTSSPTATVSEAPGAPAVLRSRRPRTLKAFRAGPGTYALLTIGSAIF